MTMRCEAEIIVWLADDLLELGNVPDLADALLAMAADFRQRLPQLTHPEFSALDRQTILDEACFAWIAYEAFPMSLRVEKVVNAVGKAALELIGFASVEVDELAVDAVG